MRQTVVVSIGRNLSYKPMNRDLWDLFVERTTRLFDAYAKRHFSGYGTGVYEGSVEDSFTLVGTLVRSVFGLYHDLERLALDFDQESIALTVGNTSFPGKDTLR